MAFSRYMDCIFWEKQEQRGEQKDDREKQTIFKYTRLKQNHCVQVRVLLDWIARLINLDCNPFSWIEFLMTIQFYLEKRIWI